MMPWRRCLMKLAIFSGGGGIIIKSKNLAQISCQNSQLWTYSPLSVSSHFQTFYSTNPKLVDDIYENVDYETITQGDPEKMKILKILILEFEVIRQESGRVPSKMTTDRWIQLLEAKSRSQRLKSLAFWLMNEKKKENDKMKKEEKRLLRLEQLNKQDNETEDDGHIKYGFGGSTIFLRIYPTTIDRWCNWKLIESMMYDQKLIVDCGYDVHMNNKEASNCAKQLTIVFAENRLHKSPFDLHFVNANPESAVMTKMVKTVPTLYDKDFPLNITNKNYLDLFPKEKLVYLTPHCREDLRTYNHDDIYIIGAMVDKENNQPLSLAKAKAEGLRMAKFPLDRYLDWNMGTKSLTLDQVLKILLDMKMEGNWEKALRHVPQRKLKKEDEPISKKKFFMKRKLYSNHF